jgi:hypothetical protein
MKTALGSAAMVVLLGIAGASAQDVNLTGRYVCVQVCQYGLVGQPAYITQNGWELNLINEAGQPTRGWFNWGGRLWADNWQQGAVYSPDGMTVQFDRGAVWQRDIAPAVVVQPGPVRRVRPVR